MYFIKFQLEQQHRSRHVLYFLLLSFWIFNLSSSPSYAQEHALTNDYSYENILSDVEQLSLLSDSTPHFLANIQMLGIIDDKHNSTPTISCLNLCNRDPPSRFAF